MEMGRGKAVHIAWEICRRVWKGEGWPQGCTVGQESRKLAKNQLTNIGKVNVFSKTRHREVSFGVLP